MTVTPAYFHSSCSWFPDIKLTLCCQLGIDKIDTILLGAPCKHFSINQSSDVVDFIRVIHGHTGLNTDRKRKRWTDFHFINKQKCKLLLLTIFLKCHSKQMFNVCGWNNCNFHLLDKTRELFQLQSGNQLSSILCVSRSVFALKGMQFF